MMVCRDQVNAAVTTTAAVPSGANLPNAGSLASLSTSNCAKLPVLGRLAPYRRHSVASTCQEPAVWRRWNPASVAILPGLGNLALPNTGSAQRSVAIIQSFNVSTAATVCAIVPVFRTSSKDFFINDCG